MASKNISDIFILYNSEIVQLQNYRKQNELMEELSNKAQEQCCVLCIFPTTQSRLDLSINL